MKLHCFCLRFLLVAVLTFASNIPNCKDTDCNSCIRSPSCMWCMKVNITDGTSRCISNLHTEARKWKETCGQENVVEYENFHDAVEDEDFSETSKPIIQMKPQKIKLQLRAGEPYNLTIGYRHVQNYPIDLYYLMDGSKSMSDDKETLSAFANDLADGIKNITSDIRLGFGVFVDKPLLPFVSTAPFERQPRCEFKEGECSPPYGFLNSLPLTNNTLEFERKVNEAPIATNKDFPEGGFDALMQAMVCDREINWRDQSARVIVLSTDAGFHYAGDGRLAGVLSPNDMVCHLDINGSYIRSEDLDYPSVSQVNYMANKKGISVIFAITEDQEPLYFKLAEHISGASSGILKKDSSNIESLLTEKVKDIISTVNLDANVKGPVKIQYFSKCISEEMTQRSSCTGLVLGDEVDFILEFQLEECPEKEEEFLQNISISLGGRQETVDVEVTAACGCKCREAGDKGYIEDAEQCSFHGTYMCGICECHKGYMGSDCQCETKLTGKNYTSDESCIGPDTSLICSNRGTCVCGICQCSEGDSAEKKIYGAFCECTNYQCPTASGKLCSGHGECVCNKCNCSEGWTGHDCDCEDSERDCINQGSKEVCSGQGDCKCNKCSCQSGYSGKYCEDCLNCSGKCDEFKPCVQCQAFQTGEYAPDICQKKCTLFNITKVPEVKVDQAVEEQCFFFDDNDCRIIFAYRRYENGTIEVRVQENVECSTSVNMWGVIISVISTIVLIGLVALLVWRITASIHDRREYQKFILEQRDAKWSTSDNPLYKKATTSVQNPLFGVNN
ncbi:integrin beta-PS-like isoform X2 [Palaemon carinicauda]|uniref:integrin beta-PS-like isoform X2 n=1 Tax=Palaemon carinicauda TaxID=392227 RepID=UPI0035B591A9